MTIGPVFGPLSAIIQVGGGKRNDVELAGVLPPDRNGMMQVSLVGTRKTITIDISADHARRLANRILRAIDSPN